MDWYPHHIGDYDADTLHLTAAQDGVYSRLLRWYYANERTLPDNDQALAGIARVGIEEWLPMAPVIRAFFVTRPSRVTGQGTLVHKRCNEVIQTQNKKRRDGKARQDKLRKNGVLEDVTRDKRVSNAARGEEMREEDRTLSPTTTTESPITSAPRREGGAGGAADADRPAALPEDRPVTGGAPAKPKAPRKPKVQRTRLAPDWTPTPAQRSYAHVAGLEDPKIDFIAVGFLRYWTGADAKNPLKADWDRTWENWVDREIANGALRSNGRVGSAGHRPEPDSGLARFLRRNLGADGQPEFSAGGRVDPPVSGMAPPGPRVRPGPIDGFGPGAIDLEPDAETGAYRVAGRTPGDDTVES